MTTLDERCQGAPKKAPGPAERPPPATRLALDEPGSEGDVRGARPGVLDIKGRAKYDVRAERRGTGREAARAAYAALVERRLAG